jgi:hypothetical protein
MAASARRGHDQDSTITYLYIFLHDVSVGVFGQEAPGEDAHRKCDFQRCPTQSSRQKQAISEASSSNIASEQI